MLHQKEGELLLWELKPAGYLTPYYYLLKTFKIVPLTSSKTWRPSTWEMVSKSSPIKKKPK